MYLGTLDCFHRNTGVRPHDLTKVPCVACNEECSHLHASVTSTGRSYCRHPICGKMAVLMVVFQNGQLISRQCLQRPVSTSPNKLQFSAQQKESSSSWWQTLVMFTMSSSVRPRQDSNSLPCHNTRLLPFLSRMPQAHDSPL